MNDILTIKRSTAEGVAEAIRSKTGKADLLTSEEWAREIDSISGAEPLVTYDQQNPLLTQYLAESAGYSPDDYTVSVALSYAYKKPEYVKSHPTGHTVTLAQGGELHLTDGGEVLTKTVAAGDHVLANTTPNKVAHWWLTVGGSVNQCGTIKPTGHVRMIATTAINVRDLGGWSCDGGTVKYGKIFRGGELSASDREVLVGQIGIRHDLDLRGKKETGGMTKSPLGDELYYTGPENYPEYTLTYPEWPLILRTIFNAAAHNEPIIFHCAAGSDRTGTVACIVEALMGIDQSDIDRDFEISTFGISLDEGSYEARRRTDTNWKTLIGEITAKGGDTFTQKVVNWTGSLGFTADEINAFRRAMIDGEPEDVTVEEIVDDGYTRVEWVQIVTSEYNSKTSHILSPFTWSEVNKIDFKLSCQHSASTQDIIICAHNTSELGTSPYIGTRSSTMFDTGTSLSNYSVTPNNIPNTDTNANEFSCTFTSTSSKQIRIGSWGDQTFSHEHQWYYIRFYKDNTMLAEYLPCYRKSDNVIGFVDSVSGEFFIDAYSGNGFTIKGDEI